MKTLSALLLILVVLAPVDGVQQFQKKTSSLVQQETVVRGGATSRTAARRLMKDDDDDKVNRKTKLLIALGDVGNLLTTVLSFWLLMKTPFDIQPCGKLGSGCTAVQTNGLPYSGGLDACYVCDGFCISDASDKWRNSHMLSLYADVCMFVPLLLLRHVKKGQLQRLGLNDFYLSNLKVNSILGHGVAHFALSLLALNNSNNALITPKSHILNAIALAGARFWNKNTWNQLKRLNGITRISKETIEKDIERHRRSFWRSAVAPFLAGTLLAQLTSSPLQPTQAGVLVPYLIFGLTSYVFFEAGIPSSSTAWIFALGMSVIVTYLSVGNVQNVQQSFVVVFTSSYLVSAVFQLFVWNKQEKSKDPVPYAVSAWVSNLLTTLVGWLLALRCTRMKELGGHVWYDLSIPISYFLLYFLTAQLNTSITGKK
jgi:hypothetical protein